MDLGFIYTHLLSFGAYIESEALRILRFVRRHAGTVMFSKCILPLYYSLVRSVMEYGSIVWSPETAQDKLRIERV